MNKNQMIGRAISPGAAIFCGFNTTLSRPVYDTGHTPVSLTIYRFLLSAAVTTVSERHERQVEFIYPD